MKEIFKYGNHYFKNTKKSGCKGCYFSKRNDNNDCSCNSSKYPEIFELCIGIAITTGISTYRPILKYRKNERD